MAHSDLRVVDERGDEIAPSQWKRQRLDTRKTRACEVALKNIGLGNTMLVTRELLNEALPFPSGVIHHDWWVALVGAAVGSIVAIDETLVEYRQHGDNLEGSKGLGASRLWREVPRILRQPSCRLDAKRTQAREFLNRYGSSLSVSDLQALEAFTNRQSSRIERFRRMADAGMLHTDVRRNIALFFLI